MECLAIDIIYNAKCDVLRPLFKKSFKRLLKGHKLLFVHIGMPCNSWTRARRNDGRGPGPLRNNGEGLFGLLNLSETDLNKVLLGNKLLWVSIWVIKQCQIFGVPWTLENPKTSRAWLTPPLKQLQEHNQLEEVHFCQYHAPWKKATCFLHSLPRFQFETCHSKNGLCSKTGKNHIILQGRDASGAFLTKKAEPYPTALCNFIADHVLNTTLNKHS